MLILSESDSPSATPPKIPNLQVDSAASTALSIAPSPIVQQPQVEVNKYAEEHHDAQTPSPKRISVKPEHRDAIDSGNVISDDLRQNSEVVSNEMTKVHPNMSNANQVLNFASYNEFIAANHRPLMQWTQYQCLTTPNHEEIYAIHKEKQIDINNFKNPNQVSEIKFLSPMPLQNFQKSQILPTLTPTQPRHCTPSTSTSLLTTDCFASPTLTRGQYHECHSADPCSSVGATPSSSLLNGPKMYTPLSTSPNSSSQTHQSPLVPCFSATPQIFLRYTGK